MNDHDLTMRYMHGRCLDMASAIGRATGLPVCRLRARNGTLAHAFVVLDRHLPKTGWRCIDAAGEMPFEAMRSNAELGSGPVSLSRDETPAVIQGVDDEDVLADARRFPHLTALLTSHVPLGPLAPPPGWAPMLESARAIAEHVVDLSPHEVDRGMVEDAYIGCVARLVWIPMDGLEQGPKDANVAKPTRERRYARMHAGSTPPILVDGRTIEDGNHRHRVAIARGDEGMWCYRIEEGTE